MSEKKALKGENKGEETETISTTAAEWIEARTGTWDIEAVTTMTAT